MAEKKGNELASISVYLNTPIVAVLLGLGFIVGSVLFAGVMLVARWSKQIEQAYVGAILAKLLLYGHLWLLVLGDFFGIAALNNKASIGGLTIALQRRRIYLYNKDGYK